MRKVFEIGGIVAAAVLVAFGVAAIVMGVSGRGTVRDSLKLEQIVGSPDMTPALIKAEAKDAGLPSTLALPTVSVAGQAINTGARARAFASYMRIHTLEATGGLTYSQLGRYTAKPGTPVKLTDGKGATNDPKYALTNPASGQPVDNGLRNLWVTETALTTALNTSYMAEQLSLFGIVVGIALLLAGLGFGILAVAGALRNPDRLLSTARAPKTVKPHDGHHRVVPAPPRTTHEPPPGGSSACRVIRSLLEHALIERIAHELGAARKPELLHDVRPMRLGRSHRDVELRGDLLVRVAEGEQAKNLALAI